MRIIILIVALLFTGALAVATALDIRNNGFNGVDAMALVILVLFATGLLGALSHRPPRPPGDS
jgi:VIT1/CCC1 family predicted Fe2+/Mn2+ transporter